MARRKSIFERVAHSAAAWTGSSLAFALAVGAVVVWALTGPYFHYSDTWQLVINTSTTIVTFLMVFLIQRSQNKDSAVLQLKLNELVAAVEGASNRLINVEDLSELEIQALHRHYDKLVALSKEDEEFTMSHSIEEAQSRHRRKRAGWRPGGESKKSQESADEVLTTQTPERGSSSKEAATNGAASPPTKDAKDAVEPFLAAVKQLEERLEWHEAQVAAHEQAIESIKAALAEHGFEPIKLIEAAPADRLATNGTLPAATLAVSTNGEAKAAQPPKPRPGNHGRLAKRKG